MTDKPISCGRRRCITVLAGALAGAALGGRRAAAAETYEWRGTAMGADARIIFGHSARGAARSAVLAVRDEIDRLEDILSLYRRASALVRLNENAGIDPAPRELRDLLRQSLWYARITGGAFDPTVQPLWRLYAGHFRNHPGDDGGPDPEAIQAALSRVGAHRVKVAASGIFLEPGTELTLNGIAQGYVTDRVAALLRGWGWRNVLVNLGEFRALGGGPWRIALPSGGDVALTQGALATSSAEGMRFSAGAHHLFDPRTGRSAPAIPPVTVQAGTATDADALSTALSVCAPAQRREILRRVPGARIV